MGLPSWRRAKHHLPMRHTQLPRILQRIYAAIALLLFVNLALGVISRVAPQMNIYAVGFPVTLTVGMLGIAATLPMLEQPILTLMQQAVAIFAAQR